MSVKIATREKLNANAYSKLVIREIEGDYNYIVNVTSKKENDEYVSVSYKLSDGFKKKSDAEKIISIVDSFLETSDINSIEPSVLCQGYPGEFIKVSGSRELYLQIENPEVIRTIVRMIKSKYDRDRYKNCYVNSSNNRYGIMLNNKCSTYSSEFVSCDDCDYHGDCENLIVDCPKYVLFKLMYDNGNMVGFEKRFIERFIYEKLWEYGFPASVIEITEDIKVAGMTKIGEATRGYCIICGNLEIMFYCSTFTKKYVLNFCNNIVNKYNEKLNELNEKNSVMKRQLKMEGF